MIRKIVMSTAAAVFLSVLPCFGQQPKLEIGTGRDIPVYKVNEPIVFTAAFAEPKTEWNGKVKATLFSNGKPVETKEFTAKDAMTQKAESDKPAWFMWTLEPQNSDGSPIMDEKGKRPVSFSYGVIVDPFAIRPASDKPADFEKRWADEIAKMRKVPMEVKFTDPAKNPSPAYRVTEVSVSMGEGCLPVTGWLRYPLSAGEKSLPIRLSLPGAYFGPFPNPPGGDPKSIAFDLNVHGVPNQNYDKEFYEKNVANGPNGYWTADCWSVDFDKCYYRNVFLRVVRALDYLKTLPQWDGKNITVQGSSQGGGLSIVAAALNPDVTSATAYVPALCDHAAVTVGRQSGWPRVLDRFTGASRDKAIETTRYFDAAHFASMVKCPITIYVGLLDGVCSPTSVFAAYNNLPESTPKKIGTSAFAGHGGPWGKNTVVLQDTLPVKEEKK